MLPHMRNARKITELARALSRVPRYREYTTGQLRRELRVPSLLIQNFRETELF